MLVFLSLLSFGCFLPSACRLYDWSNSQGEYHQTSLLVRFLWQFLGQFSHIHTSLTTLVLCHRCLRQPLATCCSERLSGPNFSDTSRSRLQTEQHFLWLDFLYFYTVPFHSLHFNSLITDHLFYSYLLLCQSSVDHRSTGVSFEYRLDSRQSAGYVSSFKCITICFFQELSWTGTPAILTWVSLFACFDGLPRWSALGSACSHPALDTAAEAKEI